MGRVKVCKEITFDCAHMLSGHNALCKNLHGHTYKLQVTVEAYPQDEGSSADMVIDFKDLKAVIKTVVMEQFDHAVIFSGATFRGAAEDALLTVAEEHNLRYVIMPERSTAEDMASYFRSAIHAELRDKGYVEGNFNVGIRLYETPTSYAEV